MKYYALKHSLDKKIVGNYPQVEEAKHNCNVWDEPKFINNYHFEKIDFEPIVSNAIVNNKSKVTDFIEASVIGFKNKLLMSGKLKKVLDQYTKDRVQFFQSGIFYKNNFIEDYWILNAFKSNMEYIDFKNSEVYKTKRAIHELEILKIDNFDQFKTIKVNIDNEGYPLGLKIKRVKLFESIKDDFFVLVNVEGGIKYIVSEKLKKEIEDASCTGIEFMPVELTLHEWIFSEREKIYGIA